MPPASRRLLVTLDVKCGDRKGLAFARGVLLGDPGVVLSRASLEAWSEHVAPEGLAEIVEKSLRRVALLRSWRVAKAAVKPKRKRAR